MKKNSVKHILDAIMCVLMIVCMGYQVTGSLWHEIIGVILFVVFVIHNVLNISWYTKFNRVCKGTKGNLANGIWLVTNLFVIIDMIILAVTSVLISKHIFSFLGLQVSYFWTWLHIASAYLGLILVSVHIGCHWKMLLTQMYRMYGIDPQNKPAKITGRIIALLMAILGIWMSFEKGIGSKFIYSAPARNNKPNSTTEEQADTMSLMSYSTTDAAQSFTTVAYGRGGQQSAVTEPVQDGESLDDYLGRIICTACGRGCLLSSPQCGRGYAQMQQATEYYESQTKQQSESQQDTNDTNENNTTEQNANQTQTNQSQQSDNNQSAKATFAYPDDKKNTSDSLPQKNQNGIDDENANIDDAFSNDKSADNNDENNNVTPGDNNNANANGDSIDSENNNDQGNGMMKGAHEGNGPYGNRGDKRFVMSGPDTILDIFTDYVPIMGLYIGGTYYALEIVRKRKRDEK